MRAVLTLSLVLSLSAMGAIRVLDDRVTESLAEKYARGQKPRLEHFHFGDIWDCFHHFSQPREGREENALALTEFSKSGNHVTVREGRLYPGGFLKGHRFDLATPAGERALKDPYSATYVTHDPRSDSLIVRFGEKGQFGTAYMICRPREEHS